MKIYVKYKHGRVATLHVNPTDSILVIKKRAAPVLGMSPIVRLFGNRRVLGLWRITFRAASFLPKPFRLLAFLLFFLAPRFCPLAVFLRWVSS